MKNILITVLVFILFLPACGNNTNKGGTRSSAPDSDSYQERVSETKPTVNVLVENSGSVMST